MLVFCLFLCTFAFFGINQCLAGYYFVIAPNILRYEHDETVSVNVFGLNNALVKVWLEYDGKRFSEKDVIVQDEANPAKTTVRVSEADIFGSVVEGKPRTLKIWSEYAGIQQSREVLLSYRSGYLIVQTDKPIYTPLQRVHIRVLALEESLKPSKEREVSIEIMSPATVTMARETLPGSDSGFYMREFTLPPYSDLGLWTARAFYRGQFETTARVHFQVDEYVLPTYGVTIAVDTPCITRTTPGLVITVRAKYVYGKPVDGTARLTLNLKQADETTAHILDMKPAALDYDGGSDGSTKEFIINTRSILDSPLLKDRDFPDGSSLEIIARVYEGATGKEESSTNDDTVFALKPFKFHFTHSKRNFRPGLEYNLKMVMIYANGQPAVRQVFKIQMFQDERMSLEEWGKTDGKGEYFALFYSEVGANRLTFKASTENDLYESNEFEVTAYGGKNQIVVDTVSPAPYTLAARVFTNIQGNLYTGIFFVVITRGNIVHTFYYEPAYAIAESLPEALQQTLSPSARILVFYVDKSTNEIVADSIRFDVEETCRTPGLHLETRRRMIFPGSNDGLMVTGSPFMWVGLNVMDKALLLLDDKNVLRTNKVFEALKSHDLGCGEGSGKSNGDVFKKSGLTVLSNAVINDEDLQRRTESCETKKRSKRYAEGLIDNEDSYLSDLERLKTMGVRPALRSDFRESWLFEVNKLNPSGEYQRWINYPESVTKWVFQAISVTEDGGICIADPLEVTTYRDFFIQLELPYKAVRLEYTDIKATVFNYGLYNNTANVYVTTVDQLCHSWEPNKSSPKIQLELPPKTANTVNFPMVPVKAGQFPIKVTAIVADLQTAMVDVIKRNLLVANEGIEEQITIQVCLDPNKDDDDCIDDVRVFSETFLQMEERENIMRVDLTLPGNSIAGTGDATGYIISNTLDNVVPTALGNVEYFLRRPLGSGEGSILRLALTVYALDYLKQTKQVTAEMEVKGNEWVRYGVKREVSQFRLPDGAFAAWQSRPASTWLTAFVAKVFCQAKKVVDNAVDEAEDLDLTINWLVQHAHPNGSFVENEPVIHRNMIGLMNERDPSLTVFVLISLMECSVWNPVVNDIKDRSRLYIELLDENILRNNTYLLALSTYALALSVSPKKWHLKALLEDSAKEDAAGMHWDAGGNVQSIETTGYALLAMLECNDLSTSAKIVRWLTSQGDDAKNVFKSVQDTVVGLQALSTYSTRTYSPDVNLDVTFWAGNWNKREQITKESAVVLNNLPVEAGDNMFMVKVKGKGSARMLIDLRYNRPARSDETCPFLITDVEVDEVHDMPTSINMFRNCDVCGKCDEPDFYGFGYFGDAYPVETIRNNFGTRTGAAGRHAHAFKEQKCIRFSIRSKIDTIQGMSVVTFGLETGMEVVKEDLDKLMEDTPNIARYEMPSQGSGFIVFYLDSITKEDIQFIFRLKDSYSGNPNTRLPSYVKIQEYYRPDLQCTRVYGTGPSRGGAVSYSCDYQSNHCQCVQSVCAQPVDQEILKMIRSAGRPAIKLLNYTCNPEKADYAILVEIEEIDFDPEKEEKVARGTVLSRIYIGREDSHRQDTMTFFWKLSCNQVEMERGKSYYVIGKDQLQTEYGLRYPVIITTLVVEHSGENRLLERVMENYTRLMQRRGCRS